jgi:hypothetical protein
MKPSTTRTQFRPKARRASRSGRGTHARARHRRRVTSRPRILRYRWWLLVHSRYGSRVTLLTAAVLLLITFAVLRRMAGPRFEHVTPPATDENAVGPTESAPATSIT